MCVVVHVATAWETCRACGGGGFVGPFDKVACRVCDAEGVAMVDAPSTVGYPPAEALIRSYCDRIYGEEPVTVATPAPVDPIARTLELTTAHYARKRAPGYSYTVTGNSAGRGLSNVPGYGL